MGKDKVWMANEETLGGSFERLTNIIRFLRTKEGCPWDKEQTHESLKPCLIEECYEVIDAIDKKDMYLLEEEIGDLLLQGVFHFLIEEERGNFCGKDVLNRVSNKMIYRHPHVFAKENAETIDKATIKWENMKRKEKPDEMHADAMENIPKTLPALLRSAKIQKKAAHVGFDWDSVDEAFAKIQEEIDELKQEIAIGNKERMMDEMGDLLFSVVNVSRFLGLDPEEALNSTSQKFINRFRYMEEIAAKAHKPLEDMTLSEMDKLWNDAKKK